MMQSPLFLRLHYPLTCSVVTFKDKKHGAPGPPSEGSPAIAADATEPAPQEAAGQQGGAAARSEWENYKLIKQLQGGATAVQEGAYNKVARTMLLQNLDLENAFKTDVAPAMERLRAVKDELGDTWAYGIFLPGFDKDRREQVLHDRRVGCPIRRVWWWCMCCWGGCQ
jgi:hypothetical protein